MRHVTALCVRTGRYCLRGGSRGGEEERVRLADHFEMRCCQAARTASGTHIAARSGIGCDKNPARLDVFGTISIRLVDLNCQLVITSSDNAIHPVATSCVELNAKQSKITSTSKICWILGVKRRLVDCKNSVLGTVYVTRGTGSNRSPHLSGTCMFTCNKYKTERLEEGSVLLCHVRPH